MTSLQKREGGERPGGEGGREGSGGGCPRPGPPVVWLGAVALTGQRPPLPPPLLWRAWEAGRGRWAEVRTSHLCPSIRSLLEAPSVSAGASGGIGDPGLARSPGRGLPRGRLPCNHAFRRASVPRPRGAVSDGPVCTHSRLHGFIHAASVGWAFSSVMSLGSRFTPRVTLAV